jgi:hypothetical protein
MLQKTKFFFTSTSPLLKMSPSLQTTIALAIVFFVAVAFAWSWWQKRHKPGCGGGCGCAGTKKKALRHK